MPKGVLLTALVLLPCFAISQPPATRPPHGWSTQAHVTRVLDGDTIEVEITRRLRVRLLDCWAPETRDPGGPESTANLKRLLGDGSVTLLVPTDSEDISDIWTFGRALGYVWSTADADKSVSQLQVEQGHATTEKVR
jgi:endonuclease YncB( thermonuclease family)